jgi:hypothetical protein
MISHFHDECQFTYFGFIIMHSIHGDDKGIVLFTEMKANNVSICSSFLHSGKKLKNMLILNKYENVPYRYWLLWR